MSSTTGFIFPRIRAAAKIYIYEFKVAVAARDISLGVIFEENYYSSFVSCQIFLFPLLNPIPLMSV